MEITFKQIGEFFSQNKLWFLIPLDIIGIILFILLAIKVVKFRRRRKNERKRQNKLHRTSKKTHKL